MRSDKWFIIGGIVVAILIISGFVYVMETQ